MSLIQVVVKSLRRFQFEFAVEIVNIELFAFFSTKRFPEPRGKIYFITDVTATGVNIEVFAALTVNTVAILVSWG